MKYSTKEMIRVAALEANIKEEQSKECIKSAFKYIQEVTQKQGFFDLSGIGLQGVYAKQTEDSEAIKTLSN